MRGIGRQRSPTLSSLLGCVLRERRSFRLLCLGLLSYSFFWIRTHEAIRLPSASNRGSFENVAQPNVMERRMSSSASPPGQQASVHSVTLNGSQAHSEREERQESLASTTTTTHNTTTHTEDLSATVDLLTVEVSRIKASGVVMETDPEALQAIEALQAATRLLLVSKYGQPVPSFGGYTVTISIKFPASLPHGSMMLIIDTADISLVPHNVYVFLEIVRNWEGGSFHRHARHVIQSLVKGKKKGLAFQEYHPANPHSQWTMGFAGRPGGPAFYISTIDNSRNHGPASQGSKSEADGCFGLLRMDDPSTRHAALLLEESWGRTPDGKFAEFLADSSQFVEITRMTIGEVATA